MDPIRTSTLFKIEDISSLIDQADITDVPVDPSDPTRSKVDQVAKAKLGVAISQLEEDLRSCGAILRCEFAQDLDKSGEIWANISAKLEKLDKASFDRLNSLIVDLAADGLKIKQACLINGTSLTVIGEELLDLVPVLTAIGTESVLDSYVDMPGWTPIKYAIATNNFDMVKLLAATVDLNTPDADGWTPLIFALDGNPAMVKFLIGCGARVMSPTLEGDETALEYAKRQGKGDLLTALIEEAESIEGGLRTIIDENRADLLNLLHELRYDLNVDHEDSDWTPLTYAVEKGNVKMVECLAACGADLNLPNKGGWTPLTYALEKGNAEMVECLTHCGADLNCADGYGRTPLIYAIEQGNVDMVGCLAECLASCGADLNLRSPQGDTPLTYAVCKNRKDIVKLLIQIDVDVDFADTSGMTPLACAMALDQTEIIELLERAGADKMYAKAFLLSKCLAQVWGLKGTTTIQHPSGNKEVSLEGFMAAAAYKYMVEYVKRYFKVSEKAPVPERAQKDIVEALETAQSIESLSDSALVSIIQEGKPLIIPGGVHDHSISMVIFGDKIAICNRGDGRKEQAVEVYQLPASTVTEAIIQKLRNIYDSSDDFNSIIKDLNLELIEGYPQKDQKAGNCGLAGAKSAVGVLFRMYTDNETGQKNYKDLTRFLREEVFMDSFKQSTLAADHELWDKIREKAFAKKDQLVVRKLLAPLKLKELTKLLSKLD